MRLDSGILSLAPSDLSRHLGCAHATTLALEAARGERPKPHAGSAYERMIQEKGDAHERAYLAELEARGLEIVTIERAGSYADMAARTRAAMQAGAPVVYQATFELGRWRGHADFLERVEKETDLGGCGYEAVDTKLARNEARPAHVLQLCFYSAGIAAVQGDAPEHMHIALGSGRRESLRPRDFDAYFARAQRSLERFVDAPPATSPRNASPVRGARSGPLCDEQWRAADDLHYVAEIRRAQTAVLKASGVSTLAALARGLRAHSARRSEDRDTRDAARAGPAAGGDALERACRDRATAGRGWAADSSDFPSPPVSTWPSTSRAIRSGAPTAS